MTPRTVFVTGANGFIGSVVAKEFSRNGYTTYGLVRRAQSGLDLQRDEVIPVVGTAEDAAAFISRLPPIDVIITCDEDLANYNAHHRARLAMIQRLCEASKAKGAKKPLVIFTSGCKDYGVSKLLHGDDGLKPDTEDSPLNPPDLLKPRTDAATDMLSNHTEEFDCVVTRPTTLWGYSGSYYSYFFSLAERAKMENKSALELPGKPNAILHGMHVADVAAAYLAIATAPRQLVSGEVYNMSARRYETLGEIIPFVERSYDIQIKLREPQPDDAKVFGLYALSLWQFPQWVGSERLRHDLGWKDNKPLFTEAFDMYRQAYEAATSTDTEQIERMTKKTQSAGTL
jgi:nucleoside-diphosphate-sugar epimerase